jgi:polyisoprenoid-binding protein YceI
MPGPGRLRWIRWGLIAVASVVALAVAGTYLYIHVIEGPPAAPLTITSLRPSASRPASQPGPARSVTGTWRVAPRSVVGYRVKEVLIGQHAIAVGRSRHVSGNLTISGGTLTAARFSVPMATIRSDRPERDAQFDGRIMDVAVYPTGVFTLSSPVRLALLPAPGARKSYTIAGNLTLHGRTRPVTFTLTAERTSSQIEVSGSIPVLVARWGIPNPSFGSFVTTENHGVLEFLLVLSRA